VYSISIGPVTLTAYTVSVALALGTGLLVLWQTSRRRGLDGDLALDAALGGLLLGVIAGRAEVILTSLDYFRERPSLALSVRQGGLGWRSLVVASVITYLAVAWRSGKPWRQYASAMAPAAAIAAAILWGGALFWGGFAGQPSSGAMALALPDRYGVVVPRLPVQAFMALANLLLAVASFVFLDPLLPAGVTLPVWGASTSALAALLGNFRSDQNPTGGFMSSSVAVDLALALAWAAFGIWLYSRPGPVPLVETDPGEGQT